MFRQTPSHFVASLFCREWRALAVAALLGVPTTTLAKFFSRRFVVRKLRTPVIADLCIPMRFAITQKHVSKRSKGSNETR